MSHPQVHMCTPIPLGWPRATALSVLLQASDLHRSSLWHMVKGMFQCYSLKSSHSHLLPYRPKVSSLYLCVFCCLAYRIVVTIFLNSYICVNILDWCFSFSYFILYNRLQFIYLIRTDLFEAFQRHQRHQWKSCQHTVILKGVCVCVCVCVCVHACECVKVLVCSLFQSQKESACNAGYLGPIPRRSPGEGKGNPRQYSGMENSMDCIVHGVVNGQTQLNNFHFLFSQTPVSRNTDIARFLYA